MHVITLASGRSFTAEKGQPIYVPSSAIHRKGSPMKVSMVNIEVVTEVNLAENDLIFYDSI